MGRGFVAKPGAEVEQRSIANTVKASLKTW